MISPELLAPMKFPVGVEVAAGAERAQTKHGLGAFECPTGAASVHAIVDEIPARSSMTPVATGSGREDTISLRPTFDDALRGA